MGSGSECRARGAKSTKRAETEEGRISSCAVGHAARSVEWRGGGTCHEVARDESAYADRPTAVGAEANREEDDWNLRRVVRGELTHTHPVGRALRGTRLGELAVELVLDEHLQERGRGWQRYKRERDRSIEADQAVDGGGGGQVTRQWTGGR